MAAIALLDALEAYLTAASLLPTPGSIGVAEPEAQADLPAVVLSLDTLTVPSPGLGDHSQVVTGALQTSSNIDVENPVLPTDPDFTLLSPDRLNLILFHGGLVDQDGLEGQLGPADIQVALDGSPFTVVSGVPASGEVRVFPAEGLLEFGAPLAATGNLVATYFLGQWERQVQQLGGYLNVAAVGDNNSDVNDLSNNLADTMAQAAENITGLRQLSISGVGAVTDFSLNNSPKRQRTMRWLFDFENIIDQAESSGGVIQRIRHLGQVDSTPYEEDVVS